MKGIKNPKKKQVSRAHAFSLLATGRVGCHYSVEHNVFDIYISLSLMNK